MVQQVYLKLLEILITIESLLNYVIVEVKNLNINIICDTEDVKMKFVERSQCKYNWPKRKRRN